MKKALSLILVFALLSLFLVSCGGNEEVPDTVTAKPFNAEVSVDTAEHVLHHVEISVEGYGKITLALDETVAPITVKNFIDLASSGFYDGLTFTRVQSGFVIQGGQSEEECDSIKGEFSSNGVENNLSHKKGVISMARTTEPDSASSQFFIMLADNEGLDGDYAAFGWVTSGMNVIEAISNDITSEAYDTSNYKLYIMGFLKEEYQPKITTIKVID